jgi:hypothetical protein
MISGDGVKSSNPRWSDPILVASGTDAGYSYTNSELLKLKNGTLLYTWNARPKKRDGPAHTLPYKIMLKRSRDQGKSWERGTDLFLAGMTFGTGCWEPAILQLASGEVQVYFADESSAPGKDQKIMMLRSKDNAEHFDEPCVVSYREHCRDGMPVPVCLQNGKGIAVAIEDNGIDGRFKPVIIHSSEENCWSGGTVGGGSPNRSHALRSDCRISAEDYAGAPYLIQLSTGETLLSLQSAENRPEHHTHTHSVMKVYVGDATAQNFASPSYPFTFIPPAANGLWNSLCQIDDKTVIAVSTISGLPASNGIWMVIGALRRESTK